MVPLLQHLVCKELRRVLRRICLIHLESCDLLTNCSLSVLITHSMDTLHRDLHDGGATPVKSPPTSHLFPAGILNCCLTRRPRMANKRIVSRNHRPDHRADKHLFRFLRCGDCDLWYSPSCHFFSSPIKESSTSVLEPASSWSSSCTFSYFGWELISMVASDRVSDECDGGG